MSTYRGPVKAFCPCDAGHPEDCKPEEWRPAHAPSQPCGNCGRPRYAHYYPDLICYTTNNTHDSAPR